MIFLKKIILFIKNFFNKHEDVKKLETSKEIVHKKDQIDFTKSLKVSTVEKGEKKEVETLICEGNGLGIQKKINY